MRLIRKFIVTRPLLGRIGRYLPYYNPSQNEVSPARITARYLNCLKQKNVPLRDKHVLEIGAGATNGVGYGLALGGAKSYTAYEPYAPLDKGLDERIREGLEMQCSFRDMALLDRVRRCGSLKRVPRKSVDLVLSHSVLEHVKDLHALIPELENLLKADGSMLHIVDYRDHFFKYPFEFLTFSERIWDRWLNPGDLPRRRIFHHIEAFETYGFKTEILYKETDREAFARIRDRLHPDFKGRDEEVLSTTLAALFVTRGTGGDPCSAA
ncbi:MAG: methyltransferase domain-containing protein [Deltaproteobacteria bacterium]|nr:methyltransferase domain-containing protein [Deltaproteobacteria bacterium]